MVQWYVVADRLAQSCNSPAGKVWTQTPAGLWPRDRRDVWSVLNDAVCRNSYWRPWTHVLSWTARRPAERREHGPTPPAELWQNYDRQTQLTDVTPALQQLHWLPIDYRITYKLCLIMHLMRIPAVRHSTYRTVFRQLHAPAVDLVSDPLTQPPTSSRGAEPSSASAVSVMLDPLLGTPPSPNQWHQSF